MKLAGEGPQKGEGELSSSPTIGNSYYRKSLFQKLRRKILRRKAVRVGR